MKGMHAAAGVMAAMLTLFAVAGCGGGPGTTTSTTTANPTITASPGAGTFGQLADSGKTVFSSRCAGCHGPQGQGGTGPPVVGSAANLGKYGTARGLYDFVKASMPMNAPGSLTQQETQQVVSFLLLQNNVVSGGTPFDESALGNVQLK